MGITKFNNFATNTNAVLVDDTAEVLYQKLGNRWYAFSLLDDEVFMAEVPLEAIHADSAEAAIAEEVFTQEKVIDPSNA